MKYYTTTGDRFTLSVWLRKNIQRQRVFTVEVANLAFVIKVFVLAVVQGIGEFLPISSSGHLLVLSRFFELPEAFTLSILLHAGTLASVVCFFSAKIMEVFRFRRRAILLVCVGSIPTVIIAAIILKFFGFLEESMTTTGVGFLLTACLLLFVLRSRCLSDYEEYYVKYASDENDAPHIEAKTIETTSIKDAIIIGIAQGIAALPGLSRSGSTISAAVARNLSREWAAEFSFLLSIPVIAGAVLLELLKVVKEAGETSLTDVFFSDPTMLVYLGGAVVSFIVGWISLKVLMSMLKDGKLHYFAYWLILAGVGTLAWSATIHWSEIASIFSQN